MNGGHFIDLQSWRRRPHFELFRTAVQPFFSVTVDVDVTALWQRNARDPRDTFSLRALHALLHTVRESEPMRLRLRDAGVWCHDRVGVGTTILRPDATYGLARFDLVETYDAFVEASHATVSRVRGETSLETMEADDVVYHSTLPWLRFTSFTNAMPRWDGIPRVVFGKVFASGPASLMPVSVEVHHALVDGLDVAQFLERFAARAASGAASR